MAGFKWQQDQRSDHEHLPVYTGIIMDKNMQGKIVKGISGFYYVHVAGSGIY